MTDALSSFLDEGIRRIQRAQGVVPESTAPVDDEGVASAAVNAWWAGLTVRQRITAYEDVTRVVSASDACESGSPCQRQFAQHAKCVTCPECGGSGRDLNGNGCIGCGGEGPIDWTHPDAFSRGAQRMGSGCVEVEVP